MRHLKYIGISVCAAMLITGCATDKKVESTELTGFLGDYSGLESVKGKGGEEIRRWVDPNLKKGKYQKLIVEPVVFYPEAKATKQISVETLKELREYTTEALQRELGKSFLLVQQAGPDTARLRIALTGVSTDAEALKVYEYIPFAAIAAGVTTATGARDRVAYMMVEAMATDSVTGKVLGKGVRRIPGKKLLKNDVEQLTAKMMRSTLDDKANSARLIMDRVLK
jgi:Protein of unknown function (DUF3313)